MLETAPPPGIDGSVGSLGASVAVSLVWLGLVCVLAFLALRWMSRRPLGPSHGPLRVLARQSIDPKRTVFVIEAAERCFLVGAGDGAMTLLAELDREVVNRDLAPKRTARMGAGGWMGALAKRSGGAGISFGDILSRTLSKKPAAAPAVDVKTSPAAAGPPKTSEATAPEGGLA